MKNTLKKIGNIFLDILVIIFLIVSLTIVVLSVTAKSKGVSNLFGYTFLSVQTDSMEPTIMTGDFIIGRVSVSDAEYEIGDVVTFQTIYNSQRILITHRIKTKEQIDGTWYYMTQGDNTEGFDDGRITAEQIVSVWEGEKIDGFGKVVDYLRSGTGFIIFLLIPVILFFLYYLYKFIKNLALYNQEKAIEEAKKIAKETATSVDEDQKAKIIAEYLASQKAKEGADLPVDENK